MTRKPQDDAVAEALRPTPEQISANTKDFALREALAVLELMERMFGNRMVRRTRDRLAAAIDYAKRALA